MKRRFAIAVSSAALAAACAANGSVPTTHPGGTIAVCEEVDASTGQAKMVERRADRIGVDSLRLMQGDAVLLTDLPEVVGFPGTEHGFPSRDSVYVFGQRYEIFGPPRETLERRPLRIGEHQGVSVFILPGRDIANTPQTVFALDRECRYQPYRPWGHTIITDEDGSVSTARPRPPRLFGVYVAVLQHVREHGRGLPIRLNEELTHAGDPDGHPTRPRDHLRTIVEDLSRQGVVQWTCRVRPGAGCQPRPETAHLYVRLGPLHALPADARVKVIPPVLPPGTSVDEALARVPVEDAEPVDTAVDVVVSYQTGEQVDGRSDVIHYRYFLRTGESGRIEVVTRWISGYI